MTLTLSPKGQGCSRAIPDGDGVRAGGGCAWSPPVPGRRPVRAARGGFEIMQEEPTGFERPGEQRPAAGEPAPPPPRPEGTQQPTAPAQGDPPIIAALRQGGAKRYLAIGAMVLAVLLLVGPFARPTVVFALLLIGVGVLLMVQDRPEQAPGSASPWPPGSPTPAAGGGQQPGEQWGQHGPGQAPQPSQGGQGPSGEPSGAAYATATQPIAHDDTRPAWDASTGQPSGGEWHPGAASAATTQSGWGSAASPAGWGAAPTSVAERRPRPRSMLGWLTVA